MVTKAEAAAQAPLRRWLTTGANSRRTHVILAHGAGAGMESAFLEQIAHLLNDAGVTVHRFEFAYMAARSSGGNRRPAPRAEVLIDEYRAAIAECRARIGPRARLYIGGKSMGGRIACLAAGKAQSDVAGVAVLGFPLVPPGKPQTSRGGIIEALSVPTLIVQGTRDPFGGPEQFSGVRIPACVQVRWIDDGDHDLKPRKASGWNQEAALQDAVRALITFFAG